MRFPNARKLELGVDVLEFLPNHEEFGASVAMYLGRAFPATTPLQYCPTFRTLHSLRTHANIDNLHVELVWRTFLVDNVSGPGDWGDEFKYSFMRHEFTHEVREKLRVRTVELLQMVLPAATVSSRVALE